MASCCGPEISDNANELLKEELQNDSIVGFMKAVTPTRALWSQNSVLDYKMNTAQCCSTTYYCACSTI